VTTLPSGIILLKATWFTETVTTILRLCLRAAILAARSIRANNSPPNIFPIGFVSLGRTKSVTIVRESLGVFEVIVKLFANVSSIYTLLIFRKEKMKKNTIEE
jgi:hypothetical protein